jgi:hypothetical protein
MSKKSRFATGVVAAAVVTAGIGFAPITPAYADTGQGTVATLAITAKGHEGPLQRLRQFVERLLHPRARVGNATF